MYSYEKRLQYPVNIKFRNPKIAQVIISQYGGPDGEAGAAMRYMSQKYAMSNPKVAGLLNDIATEELGTFRNSWNHCSSTYQGSSLQRGGHCRVRKVLR